MTSGAGSAARRRAARWSLISIVVILHLIPAVGRPNLIGGDEPHYALLVHSILADRDLDLEDDYREVAGGGVAAGAKRAGESLDRHVRLVNGRSVPIHPVGVPLLATPLMGVYKLLFPDMRPDYPLILLTVCVSFAGFLAFLSLAAKRLGSHDGFLLAFVVFYCTPVWFYSRIFMTEVYVAASVVIALWLVERNKWFLAGLVGGGAIWFKEASLLLIIPFVFYCLTRDVRRGWRFVGGFALMSVAWLGKNLVVYGSLLVTFQPYQYGDVANGLAGFAVDSSHGLLIFAPIVIVAIAGWVLESRDATALSIASLAGFVLYVLLAASWTDWRGGSGYGPRLLIPVIPVAGVPLCLLLERRGRSVVLRAAMVAAGTAGFAVNGVAASDPWNAFWQPDVVASFLARPAQYLVAGVVGLLACIYLPRLAPIAGSQTGQGNAVSASSTPAR